MTMEAVGFIKWLWTIPVVWVGSMEVRLRDKVGSKTCDAVRNGLLEKFDGLKEHVDQRFDDYKDFNQKQIDRVIREVKKNNNGG